MTETRNSGSARAIEIGLASFGDDDLFAFEDVLLVRDQLFGAGDVFVIETPGGGGFGREGG